MNSNVDSPALDSYLDKSRNELICDENDSEIDFPTLEHYNPPKPFLMKFQQQRLSTFFLAPTAMFTLGALASSWILCGLMAAIFMSENKKFKHFSVRYDNINNYSFPVGLAQNQTDLIKTFQFSSTELQSQGKKVSINFTLAETIPGPVTMFYSLDPYYQNFRSFAESGSDSQLLGNLVLKSDLYLCSPFRSPGEYYPNGEEHVNAPIEISGTKVTLSDLTYSPCGVKAWSLFNDTAIVEEFTADGGVVRCNTSDFDWFGNRITLNATQNPCDKKSISWDIDAERFRPPAQGPYTWTGSYPYNTDNEFLRNGWYYNEAGHPVPNPQDKDLISWLAISSTSSTRKVWRVLQGDMKERNKHGEKIVYRLTVDEFYPTYEMGSEKRIVFVGGHVSSWLEAPNKGIVYPLIIVAAFSFICFFIILLSRLLASKFLGHSPHEIDDLGLCFSSTKSTTLDESLRPASYEIGQYVFLSAQRRISWSSQKRESEDFQKYLDAQKQQTTEALTENIFESRKS